MSEKCESETENKVHYKGRYRHTTGNEKPRYNVGSGRSFPDRKFKYLGIMSKITVAEKP